jgi:hypothetical protein
MTMQFIDKVVQEILNATESNTVKKAIQSAISKLKISGSNHSDVIKFIKHLNISILNYDKKNLTYEQFENVLNAKNIITVMLIKRVFK